MNTVRVPTLVKFGFALLLLAASFAALPAPAEAVYCGSAPTIFYYHDSAKTQLCGVCVYWCDGYVECSEGVDFNACPYYKQGKSLDCPC